jgi:hypothetical protein
VAERQVAGDVTARLAVSHPREKYFDLMDILPCIADITQDYAIECLESWTRANPSQSPQCNAPEIQKALQGSINDSQSVLVSIGARPRTLWTLSVKRCHTNIP